MAIIAYLSIITLNVDGLKSPNRRHRVTEHMKNKIDVYVAYKRLTLDQDTHWLKVKEWQNISYAKGDKKKGGVEILTSDKIDLKQRL